MEKCEKFKIEVVLYIQDTMERKEEYKLVVKAQKGDKAALKELFVRSHQWLRGLIYALNSNLDDVDDILQEVCIKLIQNIKKLSDPASFRPWLAAIARHEAVRYWQNKKIETQPAYEVEEIEQADQSQRPDVSLAESEQYSKLLETINLLPEKYRTVLILKYIEEMTYAEISATLELTVETIQTRLVRARRMLQQLIDGKIIERIPRT